MCIRDSDYIKEAIRLSASSYGFQPYKIFVVENPELRKQLQPDSWGQSQIVDASHLFVFANNIKFTDTMVDEYIDLKSTTQNIPKEQLSGYADFMKGKMAEKSEAEMTEWTAKQAYLALGNALTAAAELGVDTCPMEGLTPSVYDKLLDLNSRNLTTAFVMTIGYRSEEDMTANQPKVRKNINELFEVI